MRQVLRLSSFVLALMVAAAPVAGRLCAIDCAPKPEHACAHMAAEAGTVKLVPVPHTCTHADEAPVAAAQTMQPLAAPPAVAFEPFVLEVPALLLFAATWADDSPPPLPPPPNLTPLRV